LKVRIKGNKIKIFFKEKLILEDVALANNFLSRFTGYMFRRKPHVNGILFEPAKSMQTTFMYFNLDILFLNKNNQIIKILREVKPWRQTRFYFHAKKALEVPSGNLSFLNEGDYLKILKD
jgi:uncharacterized membrane protein (UPF0127 family)